MSSLFDGSLFKFDMEPMEDENCSQDFEEVYNLNKSADDWLFDQIISQLQETLIDPNFENSLANYMRNHWHIFDQPCNNQQLAQVFSEYRTQMCGYLQNNIRKKIPEFDWNRFSGLLSTRKQLVDQQIMDTLQSLWELQNFKSFISDYRSAHEQEQRLKVLTIKSNKISENKTVKGKDNIFSSGQNRNMFEKGFKTTVTKKRNSKQKNQDELLVPGLILTVKGMRKG